MQLALRGGLTVRHPTLSPLCSHVRLCVPADTSNSSLCATDVSGAALPPFPSLTPFVSYPSIHSTSTLTVTLCPTRSLAGQESRVCLEGEKERESEREGLCNLRCTRAHETGSRRSEVLSTLPDKLNSGQTGKTRGAGGFWHRTHHGTLFGAVGVPVSADHRR